MYSGKELPVFDMSGGQASNVPYTLVKPNQAISVKNIFGTPGGGICQRRGDSTFNDTAMVSGSTPITGLGYMKFISGTETLLATAGTKVFKSDSLTGTMTDITGAVTVTSGQNNIWQTFKFGDKIVFIGGAPDAPFKYTGSGNAAALGGTPPSGNFGFQCNNRGFIGNTTANPSTLYWSVVADVEDWTGTGSGSTNIWTGDGDELIGAAIMNTDIVLLFKQNSIHQLLVRSAPFPTFPMATGVGACGKNAIVTNNGLAYFITPQRRMKATDGTKVIDFPSDMDDVWDTVINSRLKYIQGIVYESTDHKIIIWCVSTTGNTTNNLAIIWDLNHNSWWRYPTGHKCNVLEKTLNGVLYGGHYTGKVFKKDVALKYADDSESTTTINGRWEWGWQTQNSLQQSIHPFRLNVSLVSQNTGNLRIGYGFDFTSDQKVADVSMANSGLTWDSGTNDGGEWDAYNWSDQTNLVRDIFTRGRGNAFQVTFSNNTSGQTFQVNHFTISGKQMGQKEFSAK